MLRYDTFTRAIYVQYRGGLDRGAAAVMGMMLVILTITVLAAEQRLRGPESLHRLHGSGARRAATVHLGPWRWVAAGACALVVTVALLIPLGVIGYWLWRGTRVGEPWLPLWSLVANSLWASALGAVLTVACAWPVAMLAVRSPSRSSRFVERLSWSGHAPARHRGGARAGVLRGQVRAGGVPDDGDAGVRLHGAVPAPGDRRHPVVAAADDSIGRGGRTPARLGIVHDLPTGGPAAHPAGRRSRRRARVPHVHEGAARHAPARTDGVRHARDPRVDGIERSVPRASSGAGAGVGGAVVDPDARARAAGAPAPDSMADQTTGNAGADTAIERTPTR